MQLVMCSPCTAACSYLIGAITCHAPEFAHHGIKEKADACTSMRAKQLRLSHPATMHTPLCSCATARNMGRTHTKV